MKINRAKNSADRRKMHVRKKISGTPDRPRLSVFRSNRHIYAQIIDDTTGATLISASTMSKELREQISTGGNIKAAQAVGEALAKLGLSVGIKTVCFDRGRCKFHGRAKALAEAARKAGLSF